MSLTRVDAGFVPLVDAAALIVAREIGFAAEEGIDLVLHREASWAALRDRLVWDSYQVAHMLSPVPIALSAGLGGIAVAVDALSVLSVNGDMVGLRPDLAARLGPVDLGDAAGVGRALLAQAGGGLRIGVPFPFSMHAELLSYWIQGLGAAAEVSVRTVPPPQMVEAMALGEIDAFCVGEPWGSVAVERGVADLILAGSAIWQFAPEKVLAAKRDWLVAEPDIAAALLRAVWRAGRWSADPRNAITIAELLGRADYLDLSPEIIERPLRGRLVINGRGEEQQVRACIEFFAGAATFPWRSQAVWIADALAARTGQDRARLRAVARACFRSDIYRAVLGPVGADLPGASEKLEGALEHRTAVGSIKGGMLLGPDRFFDGRVFDPVAVDG
ncbi:MAG: CmpA/NrtA family ABC transporter substrate-binding protein [Amaricoccus sp.]